MAQINENLHLEEREMSGLHFVNGYNSAKIEIFETT